MAENKEMTLEESFDALDKIINTMDDSMSLDDAFKKYDEGVKLLKECKDKLDIYEKKLTIVNDTNTNE